jgi:formylglycine-generating enzyme required for sulfatase activity
LIGARRLSLLAILLGASACEDSVLDARPQWLVTVGTDAPVPQLGDRLLVEVLRADGTIACTGCRRQFGLSPDEPGGGLPLSFGVTPSEDGGATRLRVRLYRATRIDAEGLPSGALLIDSIGRLPDAGSVVQVALPLRMSCFGVPADEAAARSCDPATGALGPEPTLGGGELPETGSWAPAHAVPCGSQAPPGMVCVEGGVFLLGGDGFQDGASSLPERLVRVSPFALDSDEVLVGTVRGLLQTGMISAGPTPRGAEGTYLAACTFVESGEGDALPVNCIAPDAAAAVCEALGKRLPTEAEWEFAAGNQAAETPFAWGDEDIDLCSQAIVARGRFVQEVLLSIEASDCRSGGEPWGPAPGGHTKDVTALGIKNLSGNVAEYVEGALAPYDDACWGSGVLLQNPICAAPVGVAPLAVRGGSWVDPAFTARVVTRRTWKFPNDELAAIATGVRCAVSLP